MSTQGVSVQNLIKIDSAIAALRMLDKNEFGVGFLLTSFYPPVYLSLLRLIRRSYF